MPWKSVDKTDFSSLLFNFYLLFFFFFWYEKSLTRHLYWNIHCARQVTFLLEKRLFFPCNVPPLYVCTPLLVPWCRFTLLCEPQQCPIWPLWTYYVVSAGFTCFFCQPAMGMLTKTSSDVRLWDSQIFILKTLFYSSSFFSVPAPLRSMMLLHVPLITTTSWTASCEGPCYRFFVKRRYGSPFILCYHFLPTLSKKYSW